MNKRRTPGKKKNEQRRKLEGRKEARRKEGGKQEGRREGGKEGREGGKERRKEGRREGFKKRLKPASSISWARLVDTCRYPKEGDGTTVCPIYIYLQHHIFISKNRNSDNGNNTATTV